MALYLLGAALTVAGAVIAPDGWTSVPAVLLTYVGGVVVGFVAWGHAR